MSTLEIIRKNNTKKGGGVMENRKYTNVLEMHNIEMYFGKVQALRKVNFHVGVNEIVGLVGDNGAGKSTLVKILTGVITPTRGELFIRGEKIPLRNYSVKKAHHYGIETVYQDKSLGEKQVLWRNFFLGRQITNRFGFIKINEEKEIARKIMHETIGFRGVGITVDSTVSKLSGGERQGVAIGRAMHFDADLIVLDEPTVALSLKEVQKVLNFVRRIKESGRACVYISHTISHVYDICDRFVIIDRGEVAREFLKQNISLKELDECMLNFANARREVE